MELFVYNEIMRPENQYFEKIRRAQEIMINEIENASIPEEVKKERLVVLGYIARASSYMCYNILDPALDSFYLDLKKKSERNNKKMREWLVIIVPILIFVLTFLLNYFK